MNSIAQKIQIGDIIYVSELYKGKSLGYLIIVEDVGWSLVGKNIITKQLHQISKGYIDRNKLKVFPKNTISELFYILYGE